MDELDDYADNDLPPPRQLPAYLTPVVALYVSIGFMLLFFMFLVLMADRGFW